MMWTAVTKSNFTMAQMTTNKLLPIIMHSLIIAKTICFSLGLADAVPSNRARKLPLSS